MDVQTANGAFTALALLANVAFVALAFVALGTLVGGARGKALGRRVATLLGPRAATLAFVVAAVTTAGSLYYSEIEGYIPCELCWYQRILMYPLAGILGVGLLRRDRGVWMYAAPFVVLGAPLALYHWLVERVPSLSDSTSCVLGVPCAVPYFEELGYVTLAFMDLSAFLLVGALLVLARSRADRPDEPTPEVP